MTKAEARRYTREAQAILRRVNGRITLGDRSAVVEEIRAATEQLDILASMLRRTGLTHQTITARHPAR